MRKSHPPLLCLSEITCPLYRCSSAAVKANAKINSFRLVLVFILGRHNIRKYGICQTNCSKITV